MTYLDLQIDYYVSIPTISFDGDVVVDVIDDKVTIVALSGTFDYVYRGEFADYNTGGVWFEQFRDALLANPMFLARVAEEIAEVESRAAA